MPIASVIVADRYRKDLGDVSELADSIVEVGLLNPITVTAYHGGYRLVAGERRLRAFESLGLTDIPARVARNIIEARDLLVAERDENTQRKPMLLSEATALGMAIQEMEAPAAAERQAEGQRRGGEAFAGRLGAPGNTKPTESDKWGHKTRDIAAEAVGLSPATYTRMKTLVTTAADESAPEEVREAAREAVDAIDNGASVRSGYDRVKETRRKSESVTVETTTPKRANDMTDYLNALSELHPTLRIAYSMEAHEHYATASSLDQAARRVGVEWRFTERQWQAHVETSRDVLDRSSLAIDAALSAITERVDFTTITREQATEVLERLNASLLNRITKQLKEI